MDGRGDNKLPDGSGFVKILVSAIFRTRVRLEGKLAGIIPALFRRHLVQYAETTVLINICRHYAAARRWIFGMAFRFM